MVTRSEIRNSSSIRWEIYIMLTCFAFNLSMIPNNCSTSSLEREDVGSSMTMIRPSKDTAFTISTICCWAIVKDSTSVSGWILTPRFASISPARRFVSRISTVPNFVLISRPRNRFCATVRYGTRTISWCMIPIPFSWASETPFISTSWPLILIVPLSGL